MTDLATAIATEKVREAEATARADALEQHLARITPRHDLRDRESGQFRPRTSAEVHAQTVREAITDRKAHKAPLIAALTGSREHDPLYGYTPVTEYQPQRPLQSAFTFTRLDD